MNYTYKIITTLISSIIIILLDNSDPGCVKTICTVYVNKQNFMWGKMVSISKDVHNCGTPNYTKFTMQWLDSD